MIAHGECGFICRDGWEFENMLDYLFSNPEFLFKIRKKACNSYKKLRNKNTLFKTVSLIHGGILNFTISN